MVDGRIVKNFSLKEMANNESKEDIKLVITPELVRHANMLQEFRNWYGMSMTVNSWYRTKLFNVTCGGDPNSCHLQGLATDISLPALTKEKAELYSDIWKSICLRYGVIGGVSIYLNRKFMHFDSDSGRFGTTTFRKEYF